MSSVGLLDATLAVLTEHRAAIGAHEVREYGGEFSAAEIEHASYSCPAVMVTVLGSRPAGNDSKRLTGRGTRIARMAAFVVTKGARREARMREGLELAELTAELLHAWKPGEPTKAGLSIGALEDEPAIENLYGRKLDEKGQALWLLTWLQAYRPGAKPGLLARVTSIDIVDHTRQGLVPAPAPVPPGAPGSLRVTEEVRFNAPLPPAAD